MRVITQGAILLASLLPSLVQAQQCLTHPCPTGMYCYQGYCYPYNPDPPPRNPCFNDPYGYACRNYCYYYPYDAYCPGGPYPPPQDPCVKNPYGPGCDPCKANPYAPGCPISDAASIAKNLNPFGIFGGNGGGGGGGAGASLPFGLAASSLDAVSPDAGSLDAVSPDAGSPDAVSPDAGVPPPSKMVRRAMEA